MISAGDDTYNPEVSSLILVLALFVTKQAPPPQRDAAVKAAAVIAATGKSFPAEDLIPSHVVEVIHQIAAFIKR